VRWRLGPRLRGFEGVMVSFYQRSSNLNRIPGQLIAIRSVDNTQILIRALNVDLMLICYYYGQFSHNYGLERVIIIVVWRAFLC